MLSLGPKVRRVWGFGLGVNGVGVRVWGWGFLQNKWGSSADCPLGTWPLLV